MTTENCGASLERSAPMSPESARSASSSKGMRVVDTWSPGARAELHELPDQQVDGPVIGHVYRPDLRRHLGDLELLDRYGLAPGPAGGLRRRFGLAASRPGRARTVGLTPQSMRSISIWAMDDSAWLISTNSRREPPIAAESPGMLPPPP